MPLTLEREAFSASLARHRVRQFYTPVSAVLHHAAQRGWCDKPIIARPKQNPARIRWIELEEAER